MPVAVRVEARPFDGLSDVLGQSGRDRENELDGGHHQAARHSSDESERPVRRQRRRTIEKLESQHQCGVANTQLIAAVEAVTYRRWVAASRSRSNAAMASFG